ncbi:MAG: Crp/Fnr family transcriptional regulator, partial [Pseudomonadota bacterium]
MLTLDGEPVTRLYVVRSGMIRLCTNSEDGRRHVFAFVQAAGLVGFPSINRHHFTAEAVIPSRLQSVSQADLAEQLIGNVELLEAERGLLRKALRMREEHALRVASLPADQRLLSFLTDYAENAAPDMRREHGLVYLPMPRRDLADHLGLTLETVSRSFGILKRRGEI